MDVINGALAADEALEILLDLQKEYSRMCKSYYFVLFQYCMALSYW